jgi:hypothetical protein
VLYICDKSHYLGRKDKSIPWIPKSKIIAVGRNVILDMDFPEIFNYKVDRKAPLPSGEPAEKIAEEV